MVQQIDSLVCKHEDLSLGPQPHANAWHGVVSSVTLALLGVGTEGFQELSA